MHTTLRRFIDSFRKKDETPFVGGVGQTAAEDIEFEKRFRRLRKQSIHWRVPTEDEARRISQDPVFEPFGDYTYAVAENAGEFLFLRERNDWGWPEGALYVLIGLTAEKVTVAADFSGWPHKWKHPPQ